jgi:putative ABC transport system permease protein
MDVILGVIATFIVAHFADWDAIFSAKTLLLGVAASAAIGLVFGRIPARKASFAGPVQSLRAE